MELTELYLSLVKSFSDNNLNTITGKLISLYKSKDTGKIREIANKVSRYFPINEEKDAKCFSKLIILFHPDKGEQIRKNIEVFYQNKQYSELERYSYIFIGEQLEFSEKCTFVNEDIDYNPGYGWDDIDENPDDSFVDFERSFFNLIKMREYGDINIELPTYYLEDFEEFEMTESSMESLDGIEFCTHTKILDISNNMLSDIDNLWGLQHIEELYLANNQIGYIDSLANLTKLKILDISGNQIDDITPLLGLANLEYVNLIGNNISKEQTELLKKNYIIVTHS